MNAFVPENFSVDLRLTAVGTFRPTNVGGNL